VKAADIQVVVVGIGPVFETNDMIMASTKFYEWMAKNDKTVIMLENGQVVTSFWGRDFIPC
jgi:hypothetical protein